MLDLVKSLVRDKNLLLVTHDAGGANQLFSLFEKVDSYASLRVVCDGPAKRIFEQIYQKNFFDKSNLSSLLSEVDIVVTGTGMGSNLEYVAVAMAKKKGLFVVSLLDHWVNYPERFVRFGVQVLPDEIWVTNNHAYHIANNFFPSTKIRLVPDIYMENIIDTVNLSGLECKKQALFLLEPIVYEGRRTESLNSLEIFYFESFLKKWRSWVANEGVILKLRIHPTESRKKYSRFILPSEVVISDSMKLSDDLAESEIVFGYHSYAMTIAAKLGKKVFCALPSGVECKLPQFINLPRTFHEIL